MLQLLAHRGDWHTEKEKNSPLALCRALEKGWGIELDVRDRTGELVISHDMPGTGSTPFDAFLGGLSAAQKLPCLAINIKADGLASVLLTTLKKHGINNYFVFDMSVPDTRSYLTSSMPVFSRISEEENPPSFVEAAKGYWLDSFQPEGIDLALVRPYLRNSKKLALVSPELHGRAHEAKWLQIREFLKQLPHHEATDVYLCTDKPDEAAAFFEISND